MYAKRFRSFRARRTNYRPRRRVYRNVRRSRFFRPFRRYVIGGRRY